MTGTGMCMQRESKRPGQVCRLYVMSFLCIGKKIPGIKCSMLESNKRTTSFVSRQSFLY